MRRSLGPARTALWAAILTLFVVVAPAAAAANVQCGDVITQNTKLDSDVVCVGETDDPVTGVVIGADGITLNLNGFTIRGPNMGEPAGPQPGVRTEGDRVSITVKNGKIEGFYQGLSISTSNSAIRNVESSGLTSVTGDGNLVRNSRLVHGGGSGLVVRGNDNRIAHNTVHGGDDHGMNVSGARNRLIGNTVDATQGFGIYVNQFSDIVIKNNDVSDRSGVSAGIGVLAGTGGLISGNVASDHSGNGMYIDATNLMIRGNEASRNGETGIWVKGSGNTVKRNAANDNGEHLNHYGIRAEPGNVDGGANRARGNGAPSQCLGVVCN